MDATKVKINGRKAMLNRMVTAITNHGEMKSIQKDWLLEYIYALFEERSDGDGCWEYTQADLIAVLEAKGVERRRIIDKSDKGTSRYSYYRRDEYLATRHTVEFRNYTVSLSHYHWTSSIAGERKGTRVSFLDSYRDVDLCYMPVEMAAETLVELDTLIPEWMATLWPDFLLEAQKLAKIKSINENTIEAMVKVKLAGTGIRYSIEKQKIRVKVFFNLDDKMQLEWYLPHKKFMQQIDAVIEAVKAIRKVVADTGTTFGASRIDRYIHWE